MRSRRKIFQPVRRGICLLETTRRDKRNLKSDKVPVTPSPRAESGTPKRAPDRYSGWNILDQPLANIGLNRRWVLTELEKAGVALENCSWARWILGTFTGPIDDAVQLPRQG